jgi:hypothetical protein
MKSRLALCAALVCSLTGGLSVLAHAEGSDKTAKATFVGAIKPSGKKAKLKVHYQCAKGKTLWISAKESKSGAVDKRLNKEGSSKTSASWLESHRNAITCDGSSHTHTFSMDTVEKGSKGKLVPGHAYVQFCITKGEDLTLSVDGWVKVS